MAVGGKDVCPCGSELPYDKCHGSTEARSRAVTVRLRTPPTADVRVHAEQRLRTLTAAGPKKLVLAYPEYSSVTAPPLGVAYLKGHLQRELREWSVKVIDLNLDAYQQLFKRLAEGPLFSTRQFPEGRDGELALIRGAETFRGAHPDEFYDDAEKMVQYSLLWNRATRNVLFQPNVYAEAFNGRAAMPERTRRHADMLLAQNPTAIGVSICYIEQYWAGLCLAKALRERAPDMPLLLGGTMFKEGIAHEWAPARWPVDYIVSGAGELPTLEILAGRAEGGNVPGVTVVEGAQLRTTPPFYDTDFNAIADADFSDFDARAYYTPSPIVPIQTTRGCYWKRCTFCNHYKTVGGSYQLRTMDSLIAELRRHVANGTRHFTFVDDIISPARFNNMSKAILDAGLSIRYHAMSRPMRHFTPEILGRMYDAGCRFVLWGVESGSQRVLDLMEKGTIVADVEQCLELSAAAGIKNHVFVMCGFPTETREEFQQTLAFLERARPNIAAAHKSTFGLEQGTPVYDNPEKFGLTRVWAKKTPLLYDWESKTGMSAAEARKALDDARPFFRSFAAGKALEKGDFRFRDHMLFSYCRDEIAPSHEAGDERDAHEREEHCGDALRQMRVE